MTPLFDFRISEHANIFEILLNILRTEYDLTSPVFLIFTRYFNKILK